MNSSETIGRNRSLPVHATHTDEDSPAREGASAANEGWLVPSLLKPSIATHDARVDSHLAAGGSLSDPTGRALVEARDEAISDYTGNDNAAAYDPKIAAAAQRDGITYNRAVEIHNLTPPTLAQINGTESSEPAEFVREMPWESKRVNDRIDQLVTEEGVSTSAATTIAMTERTGPPRATEDSDSADNYNSMLRDPSFVGDWQPRFAAMATRAGAEIARWAETAGSATATVDLGAGDDAVTVAMDGDMLIVTDRAGAELGRIDSSTVDRIVILGGDGNDSITVDASVKESLMLVGGAGNDTISGGSGDDIIVGGAGDDNLEGLGGNDVIVGGAGDDYGSGGDGRDTVQGGAGRDSLYGGRDSDLLLGGSDNDYLDGGGGADGVYGQSDDDVVAGGRGDDYLDGGAGADRHIGASGDDRYGALQSGDHVIAEMGERVDASAERTVERRAIDPALGRSLGFAEGSRAEFRTRVADDLETLRATGAGSLMLRNLDANARPVSEGGKGNGVTMRELTDRDNGFADTENRRTWRRDLGAANTPGDDVIVSYNPSTNPRFGGTEASPPVTILFHEFAHAWNMTSGNGISGTYENGVDPIDSRAQNVVVRNADGSIVRDADGNVVFRSVFLSNVERQAVGLPVDHDDDASTPEQLVPWHPEQLTENGLRRELGLERRDSYKNP